MGRAVAADEPMWLPEDTDLALEWQAEQAVTCSDCRQPSDETTDPSNEDSYAAHAVVCFACEAIQQERARFEPGELDGMKFYVTRG